MLRQSKDTASETNSIKPVLSQNTKGRLELEFSTDADGRTFLSRQLATYPFHICRAQYLDPGLPQMASLYLQSCSGGLFAGDQLNTYIRLNADSQAHVTTQASTIVHRSSDDGAQQSIKLSAARGSFLEYMPDPMILFPKAKLTSQLVLHLTKDATAILADSFLMHDPNGTDVPFGLLENEIKILQADGKALVVDRFRIKGEDMGKGLAGLSGRFCAYGSLIVANQGREPTPLLDQMRNVKSDLAGAVYLGLSSLPKNCGVGARILASDGHSLTETIRQLWTAARHQMTGQPPGPRRK